MLLLQFIIFSVHFNFPFGTLISPHYIFISLCMLFIIQNAFLSFIGFYLFRMNMYPLLTLNLFNHLISTYSSFFSESFLVLLFLLVFRILFLLCVASLFLMSLYFCLTFPFPLCSNEKVTIGSDWDFPTDAMSVSPGHCALRWQKTPIPLLCWRANSGTCVQCFAHGPDMESCVSQARMLWWACGI